MSFPLKRDVEIPLLQLLEQLGGEARPRDVYEPLANSFPDLTREDLDERMENGTPKWHNLVQWVRQQLVTKGEIERSAPNGVWRITPAGKSRLIGTPLDNIASARAAVAAPDRRNEDTLTPSAVIESAHRELRGALAEELLQVVLSCSSEFFERLVVDLLVTMGYGGTRKDAGEALGRIRDGGIDGIIKEDRLGLGIIYLQAKRWDTGTSVGRPEIQKFAGALEGHRAQKGVFITTTTFSRDAVDYISRIGPKIVLIDGQLLTRLMIDFSVGVTQVASYEIKRVDSDYFSED